MLLFVKGHSQGLKYLYNNEGVSSARSVFLGISQRLGFCLDSRRVRVASEGISFPS